LHFHGSLLSLLSGVNDIDFCCLQFHQGGFEVLKIVVDFKKKVYVEWLYGSALVEICTD
jgi:hypothetical protein